MPWIFETDRVENWAQHSKAFTPEECKQIIEYANTLPREQGKVQSSQTVDGAIHEKRKANLSWIEPNADTAWIYNRLTYLALELNKTFFNFDLYGFMENLQFTEYNEPGGTYGFHTDKTYNNIPRKLSLSLQLSDASEYEGGELQVHTFNDNECMDKTQGTLLAFPSYVVHRVKPVTKGTRYSLVGWITGKPFK